MEGDFRESERRLIQKELFLLEDQKEAAELRFRAMFETALVGLFRFDVREGLVTDANREAARTFGFDSTDEFVRWMNERPNTGAVLGSMPPPEKLIPGEPYSFSTRVQRRDAEEFWAQVSVRYSDDGLFVEGAVKDVTDQIETLERLRMAKAEAEDANEAKSRFLATMSHEIRTPLNGIIGFAEILSGGHVGDPKEYARKILDESDRLMILINQLLDISRLEADKIILESILLDLNQVVEEAEDPLLRKIGLKGLEYSRNVEDKVPRWFIGDPMRLRQILSNLLANAVKFSDEGRISLEVSAEPGSPEEPRIRFAVKDQGIGIPKEKQRVIFESFEQADTSIGRKYGGTGLGVAICRQLVELMGGNLRVESRVGKGSEFSFTIPVRLPPETMDGVPAHRYGRVSGTASLNDCEVLVVEDYETNKEIARYHLESAGCRVHHASDGQEAIKFVAENDSIDLIVMDVHMPVLDGLEATKRLRSMGCTIPIIGMTASAFAEDRIRCLESGMDDFLSKPLRRAHFLGKAADWVSVGKTDRPDRLQNPSGESKSAGAATTVGEEMIRDDPPLDQNAKSSLSRFDEFLEELEGDQALASEVYDGFIFSTARQLEEASSVLHSGDFSAFHRKVHGIKGGAMNIMADRLAETALRCEIGAKSAMDNDGGDRIDLINLFDALADEFSRFQLAWEQQRKGYEAN